MAASLDEDVWTKILMHVPLPDRLCSCSRVSKELCRAAAAATEQLEVNLQNSQQRAEGFVHWLHHNGQHVTSLRLEGFDAALTELPCLQLRQLVVSGGTVQLGPSSSHPGVLQSCSGITKLAMLKSISVDNDLAALSAIPVLQHLQLFEIYTVGGPDRLTLPGSILQVLTQLTFLKLDECVEVTAEALKHISALQHLEVLELHNPIVPLSPSSTPGLAQLTALHTIILSGVTFDAAVLQHHTQLQALELRFSHAGSGAALLSVIGQQPLLQLLLLEDLEECEWPPTAAAYTALTASSRLQELSLAQSGDLPAGIFRPEQQLPHLQTLVLPSALSSTDIRRLVACCPALQALHIDLQPDVQPTALPQLTALTHLTIYEATESSVKTLSGLSRLRALDVYTSTPCSPAALLPLTALRQLTSLYASNVEGLALVVAAISV